MKNATTMGYQYNSVLGSSSYDALGGKGTFGMYQRFSKVGCPTLGLILSRYATIEHYSY